MGRESAYTGKLVTWDEMLNSDLDLFPKKMEFGQVPRRAVPIPACTPLSAVAGSKGGNAGTGGRPRPL